MNELTTYESKITQKLWDINSRLNALERKIIQLDSDKQDRGN